MYNLYDVLLYSNFSVHIMGSPVVGDRNTGKHNTGIKILYQYCNFKKKPSNTGTLLIYQYCSCIVDYTLRCIMKI